MENETSVRAHELVVVAHLVAALAFLASTHRLLPATASSTFHSFEASASELPILLKTGNNV